MLDNGPIDLDRTSSIRLVSVKMATNEWSAYGSTFVKVVAISEGQKHTTNVFVQLRSLLSKVRGLNVFCCYS